MRLPAGRTKRYQRVLFVFLLGITYRIQNGIHIGSILCHLVAILVVVTATAGAAGAAAVVIVVGVAAAVAECFCGGVVNTQQQ